MDDTQGTAPAKSFSGKQVLLFVLVAVLVTAGLSFWLIRTYIHPGDFKPVSLSAREQGQLDAKLRQLGVNPRELLPNAKREDQFDAEGRLVPEKYSEDPEKREIRMSERELNALIANNPELARRLAIDLSDNLASAKLLIPVDPDMPVLGGRILRVNAGIEVAYREERPVVKLRGISIMGVPVPNAWLGNLKNVDLVQEFGTGPGFWNSFAAGVDLIEVVDGQLHIKLRE
jgi:plasmid maintenance system antidote protein VapI